MTGPRQDRPRLQRDDLPRTSLDAVQGIGKPLQRHGHLRSVRVRSVRRGQDGMNGDCDRRRFDDIGHFAHVPEHRCTGASEVVSGPISRIARLLDRFGLAVPIEQPCPCACGENQSIGAGFMRTPQAGASPGLRGHPDMPDARAPAIGRASTPTCWDRRAINPPRGFGRDSCATKWGTLQPALLVKTQPALTRATVRPGARRARSIRRTPQRRSPASDPHHDAKALPRGVLATWAPMTSSIG